MVLMFCFTKEYHMSAVYKDLIVDEEGYTYSIEQWLVDDIMEKEQPFTVMELFNAIGQELDIFLATNKYFKVSPFHRVGHVNARG